MTTQSPAMTLPEQIDFFFAAPLPMQSGFASALHLNRREVQDCLLGDVIAEDAVVADPRRHRVFATVMVIAAGVDLLAKFYAGSDAKGQVGRRMLDFAERFMFPGKPTPRELAQVLYIGCRNPLLHSFTLHSHKYKMSLVMGSALSSGAIWRAQGVSDTFVVSVEGLYLAYINAIGSYEAELRRGPDLQAKFATMFPSYGGIPMWVATMERR